MQGKISKCFGYFLTFVSKSMCTVWRMLDLWRPTVIRSPPTDQPPWLASFVPIFNLSPPLARGPCVTRCLLYVLASEATIYRTPCTPFCDETLVGQSAWQCPYPTTREDLRICLFATGMLLRKIGSSVHPWPIAWPLFSPITPVTTGVQNDHDDSDAKK